MNEDEEYPSQQVRLIPCDSCGRNFAQQALVKHRNICKKTSTKARKIFDSGKQRSEGSDVIYQKTKETKKVQVLGEKPDIAPPASNWREKHNQFIKNVRNARVVTEAIKTGAPVPKFEASAVPSDYVNCSFCGRNFSSAAAERHIPFCEQQKKRQKMSANNKPKPAYGQKKASADSSYGRYGSGNDSAGAQGNANGKLGYQSGNNGKGYTSGNDRKPIKYDSNLYYESDGTDSGYGMKNRSANLGNNKTKEQMLRTGRNQSNNELNTMARNRGQKESPMASREASRGRYGNQPSPSGPNRGNGGYPPRQNSHNAPQSDSPGVVSKFCHECGSEFPVKWARFCSFCGDRRL